VRFKSKQYDTEAVIFDTASGDTHYLAPLSFAIFTFSCAQPQPSRTELHDYLNTHYDFDPTFPLESQLDDALAGLHKIGLLSPA
jgi:PqqD family protein of HPr-rel-A system